MTRKRRDNHHAEIRDGLRAAGYFCHDTADAGHGYPDLTCLCKNNFVTVLLEVKTPGETLTPSEEHFHTNNFYPGPLAIVTSLESAIEIMAYYDQWRLR
jgi:hypothetical protein